MKSIRYFLIISLWGLLSPAIAMACGGPYYLPSEYYMFRVYDSAENSNDKDAVTENCLAWQQLTSKTIPLADIRQVVYKMTLEEYENFYHNGWTGSDNNLFAQWIRTRDREILDFLLLAKTNEHIRFKRSSRWYYPTMRTGTPTTLDDIIEQSLSHTSPRLRDRYLLQAVRALFSLSKYEECTKLWNDEIAKLPKDNTMRKLAQPYIAGAEFHLGNINKALQYYAELGDFYSIAYCSNEVDSSLPAPELIAIIHKYDPDSDKLCELLQNSVRKIELYGEYSSPEERNQLNKLYNISRRIAEEKRVTNLAMWYYSAAFLADLRGDVADANHLLKLAEQSNGTAYIKESIKVLRIYLDAKTLPYNGVYEQRLFTQLQWLDAKIKNNITSTVAEQTASMIPQKYNESYYYWNDMMRRILLSEVCPRMIKAGKTTRALQLANMADNRLLGLVDYVEAFYFDEQERYWSETTKVDLNEYRHDTRYHNRLDYSNHFFKLIDTIGVDNTIAYYERVKTPRTEFDNFLNERGYKNHNYLKEIIGTQCMRNMRYADAVRYYASISPKFYGHLNVYQERDPFTLEYITKTAGKDFRYHFAREMYTLEKEMHSAADPNQRARAMVRYAIGLRNSIEYHGWALTRYSYSARTNGIWERSREKQNAEDRISELIASACQIITDREYAAKVQYDFCNFREVATTYYDTSMAKIVWGKCDRLIDYHAEKKR